MEVKTSLVPGNASVLGWSKFYNIIDWHIDRIRIRVSWVKDLPSKNTEEQTRENHSLKGIWKEKKNTLKKQKKNLLSSDWCHIDNCTKK